MTAAHQSVAATAGRASAATDMRTRNIQAPQLNPRPTGGDSSESARHENLYKQGFLMLPTKNN